MSSRPSIQQEPGLMDFASVTPDTPDDPTPASVPSDSSGPSASTSTIQSTAAPDPLAADLGLLSTLSDAVNQFALSNNLGPVAYASCATNVTATPSHVFSGLSGSTSAAEVDDELAAELKALVSLSTSSGATSPSQPIFDYASAIESATGDNLLAAKQSTSLRRHSKQRKRAKRNTSDSFIRRCTDLAFRFRTLSRCIEWQYFCFCGSRYTTHRT